MGLTTPLSDTVSLPIGADEVNVIDMASAYTAFANGGSSGRPMRPSRSATRTAR